MFNARDAQRIANAVMAHERRGRNQPPITYPTVPAASTALKLSKTTAAWTKNSTASLTEYTGTAGSETAVTGGTPITAYNKLGNVATGKWVIIGFIDGDWYLVAVEPEEVEVITGVTLGAGGLTFTRKTLIVFGEKTPPPSPTIINTVECP
jgi:hypothetical protein